MARNVKVNHLALQAVAKRAETAEEIRKLAEEVASSLRGMGIYVEGEPGSKPLPVQVFYDTTDRARASVQITHPSGRAVQAKHGALTKAASQAGLTIRGD